MYRHQFAVNTKGNGAFCIVPRMDKDIHDRLKDARKKAGYKSASEAARHFGWKDSTYRHHENGTRGIKPDEMKRYSSAYRVPMDWLVLGKKPGSAIIPVIGDVGPGGVVHMADTDEPVEGIEGPPDLRKGAAALKVMGDSMYPRYFEGDLIVYKQPVPAGEANGHECVVELKDGTVMIRILHMHNGIVSLDGINTPPLHDAAISWVAPVSWVKRK